jgi:hypothetical protein
VNARKRRELRSARVDSCRFVHAYIVSHERFTRVALTAEDSVEACFTRVALTAEDSIEACLAE